MASASEIEDELRRARSICKASTRRGHHVGDRALPRLVSKCKQRVCVSRAIARTDDRGEFVAYEAKGYSHGDGRDAGYDFVRHRGGKSFQFVGSSGRLLIRRDMAQAREHAPRSPPAISP